MFNWYFFKGINAFASIAAGRLFSVCFLVKIPVFSVIEKKHYNTTNTSKVSRDISKDHTRNFPLAKAKPQARGSQKTTERGEFW